MTTPGVFTPYSTVRPMFPTALPSWVAGQDQERVVSYQVYEELYWTHPQTFKLVQRGSEANPIYIPSGKTIVEACNRFLARGFGWEVNPRGGSPEDQLLIRASLRKLFKRETFMAKFKSNKRYGLIRGDFLWHIVADDTKAAGTRISIYELDPASYFPITDEADFDKVIGCHIIEPYEENGKPFIRRQTYRKVLTPGKPSGITSELAIFEVGAWDDREGQQVKLYKQLKPVTPLPPSITALPVYHIKNFRTPANPFGSSEMRGMERLMAAINQSITDEELALALDGLGLYATTSGPPVNDDGDEVDWILGPGRVVEIDADATFERVSGVSDVSPMQQHLEFLTKSMRESSGTPDIAVGIVDATIAESGIARVLQMGPILAKNEEKMDEITDVHDQMFYDLVNGWLPAYEAIRVEGVEVEAVAGDPLPVDRAGVMKEITDMMSTTPPLISAAYARELLRQKLGYEFPAEMGVDVVQEMAAMTEASGLGDPFQRRLEEELGADADTGDRTGANAGA